MRCPNCGTLSNISTGFCACCGSPLPESADASTNQQTISPIHPGENFFPAQSNDSVVQTVEKLEIDTSFEDAQAQQKHKQKVIIISVVCGVLALIAIIIGVILAVHSSTPEETTAPTEIDHVYDSYYESLAQIEATGKYFISSEVSTPDGQLRQIRYATDGTNISAVGIFDNYNVLLTADSLYIISTDGIHAALVADEMLNLCKGFTKESCVLNMAAFGIERPTSEPTDTVNAGTQISCTYSASDEQKAQGIFSYISVYDSNGILKSTEYFDESGASLKTIKFNEITGVFDPAKYLTPSASLTIYTKSAEIRAFLGTIFEEEVQGDITVPGIGLSCTIPVSLFAVYNGVNAEDAVRCGFTEIDTAELISGFSENTHMKITDGTSVIGELTVFSSSSASYASLSSMTDINNSLMDYYAASSDSISFISNIIYNNIRYSVMEANTLDGRYSIIYDTIHAGLHLKFIFTYQTRELALQGKELINEIIKTVSIDSSSITAILASEYQSYTDAIDEYGISCTVPEGWFAVSAGTTQNEAAALGFTSVNIDSFKSLLEPDGGIFAILTSVLTSDNITCEFYAAEEADRNTLDATQLNAQKNDIIDFYSEKYSSTAVVEETVRYNNIVYFVINIGSRLIYETVYDGYYYVFSFNAASITDTARETLKNFVSTININSATITAVPSVTYTPVASQAYESEIGDTGLSCTIPAGWFCIKSGIRQSDAVASGFENINVSDYTYKINNSERLVACIVCADNDSASYGAEIDVSEFTYSSADFSSLSESDFKTMTQTFTGYYDDVFDAVEYSGTVTFHGLKYVIISAYSSGKGVRIYETVYNGINYTIYMQGSSGALSPTELSELNSFVSSITP